MNRNFKDEYYERESTINSKLITSFHKHNEEKHLIMFVNKNVADDRNFPFFFVSLFLGAT